MSNVSLYINKMSNADFKKFRNLASTSIFNKIIGEVQANQYIDAFQQQCDALGIPREFTKDTESMILLARAIATRYIREK